MNLICKTNKGYWEKHRISYSMSKYSCIVDIRLWIIKLWHNSMWFHRNSKIIIIVQLHRTERFGQSNNDYSKCIKKQALLKKTVFYRKCVRNLDLWELLSLHCFLKLWWCWITALSLPKYRVQRIWRCNFIELYIHFMFCWSI